MITDIEVSAEIKQVMALALTGAQVYEYDEIPENHTTVPALEIYVQNGEESRGSFGDTIRNWTYVFHLDLYGSVRSNLPRDLEITTPYVGLINTALREWLDGLAPNDAIKEITWNWTRQTFKRGNDVFAGLRFVVEISGF